MNLTGAGDNPIPPNSADPWESLAASESDLVDPPIDALEPSTQPLDLFVQEASPAPVPAEASTAAESRPSCWTIPLLCFGIGIIACCVLIPQADANRRMVYERQKLQQDLESIQKQVATNEQFLKMVTQNPNLAERLAQRQMKIIREGTRILPLKNSQAVAEDMSPFHLVTVAPPAPMPPYRSKGGLVANLCYRPRSRLYLLGSGLVLLAAGLVLGYLPRT